ncbi:MAG: 2-oxo acid dehydrogenase subunit E2 [Clostridia bacterium]|nr:2-oxo acid dehydrogenase subunit E2 [Clostridia bacterium]
MANFVIMPRQGQSVESCIITTWHKKVGDEVNEGDVLFSYETDKSAFDEPSQFSGVILHSFAEEGDVVDCLKPVCIVGTAGEDISALIAEAGGASSEEAAAPAEAAEAAPAAETVADAPVVTKSEGDIIRISPRAKNLALKTGVDMTKVAPTGPHGRIIERDINAALDAGYVATTAAVEDFLAGKITAVEETAEVAAPAAAPVAAAPADDFRAYTETPFSNVRKVIAKAMHASLSEMAQLTLNSSFDATSLLNYRKLLKDKGEAMGLSKVTINDMVLYAVSRVLPNYPEINANVVDNTFRKFAHANIGMAVDTDRGLLVPVIFGSDTLSLAEISQKTKALAGSAREGTLSPDDMSGGSFTVSNLGSMGVESFTPVINPPQTAILGVCCTTNRLKADGSVYPAMGLSLTFDHRAVDGAPAAKFLKELCTALENFELLLAK